VSVLTACRRTLFLANVLHLLCERLSSAVLSDAEQVISFIHSVLHSDDSETVSLALALLTGLLMGMLYFRGNQVDGGRCY